MQIQYELLKHRQSEYLKAIYETRGKQRIHGKSLLTISSDLEKVETARTEQNHNKETTSRSQKAQNRDNSRSNQARKRL